MKAQLIGKTMESSVGKITIRDETRYTFLVEKEGALKRFRKVSMVLDGFGVIQNKRISERIKNG